MGDAAQIDRNFAIKSELGKENIRFYNVEDLPFRIHGIFKESGQYRRMPREAAQWVSKTAPYAWHTGRRFVIHWASGFPDTRRRSFSGQ